LAIILEVIISCRLNAGRIHRQRQALRTICGTGVRRVSNQNADVHVSTQLNDSERQNQQYRQ
jgi:hypothetical protein